MESDELAAVQRAGRAGAAFGARLPLAMGDDADLIIAGYVGLAVSRVLAAADVPDAAEDWGTAARQRSAFIHAAVPAACAGVTVTTVSRCAPLAHGTLHSGDRWTYHHARGPAELRLALGARTSMRLSPPGRDLASAAHVSLVIALLHTRLALLTTP